MRLDLQWRISKTIKSLILSALAKTNLYIPVHISELVERVDGADHLSDVKYTHIFGKPVIELAKQSEQVTTDIVVHQQVLSIWKQENLIKIDKNKDRDKNKQT